MLLAGRRGRRRRRWRRRPAWLQHVVGKAAGVAGRAVAADDKRCRWPGRAGQGATHMRGAAQRLGCPPHHLRGSRALACPTAQRGWKRCWLPAQSPNTGQSVAFSPFHLGEGARVSTEAGRAVVVARRRRVPSMTQAATACADSACAPEPVTTAKQRCSRQTRAHSPHLHCRLERSCSVVAGRAGRIHVLAVICSGVALEAALGRPCCGACREAGAPG